MCMDASVLMCHAHKTHAFVCAGGCRLGGGWLPRRNALADLFTGASRNLWGDASHAPLIWAAACMRPVLPPHRPCCCCVWGGWPPMPDGYRAVKRSCAASSGQRSTAA